MGLYQYTRLPFGIASDPALFQQTMEKVLHGMSKVVCYMDDVCVTGKDDSEHLANLNNVFQRLREHGLRLQRSKCAFMQTSVEYLGYKIDSEGIHTSCKKVEAILEAPRPQNTQQLRSFLGLTNYYGKFIPNLATKARPLNNLLCQKVKWAWTPPCETAFHNLKEELASSTVLNALRWPPTTPTSLRCLTIWVRGSHLPCHARWVGAANCLWLTDTLENRTKLCPG